MLLILMHVPNLVKIRSASFILKILSGNEILMSFKGHNSKQQTKIFLRLA